MEVTGPVIFQCQWGMDTDKGQAMGLEKVVCVSIFIFFQFLFQKNSKQNELLCLETYKKKGCMQV